MNYSILILYSVVVGEKLFKYHKVNGEIFVTDSLGELSEEMSKLSHKYATENLLPVQILEVTNTFTCTDNLRS